MTHNQQCTCKQIIFNAQEKSLSLSLNSKHALMHSKHNHGVCHLSHTSGVPSKVPTERDVVKIPFISTSFIHYTDYWLLLFREASFCYFPAFTDKKKQEKKKKNKTHFSIVDSIFHFSDALSCVMWLRAFDTNTHTHTRLCVELLFSHTKRDDSPSCRMQPRARKDSEQKGGSGEEGRTHFGLSCTLSLYGWGQSKMHRELLDFAASKCWEVFWLFGVKMLYF